MLIHCVITPINIKIPRTHATIRFCLQIAHVRIASTTREVLDVTAD